MPDTKTRKPETHSYQDGMDHYKSPDRMDGVKVQWEEPFTCNMFSRAITRGVDDSNLRVLDIGCGVCDGYKLLRKAADANPMLMDDGEIFYHGVDLSSDMVKTGREKYADDPHVTLEQADILDHELEDEFDLYLSCGVPYSHLTKDQTEEALSMLMRNIARHGTQSAALVVDVLGRYSIEWTKNWDSSRWPYRMSFFNVSKDMKPTRMTFYSARELGELVYRSAMANDVTVTGLEFFDRSIMVGRHTSTREYNPNIPPYRNVVNNLIDQEKVTTFNDLLANDTLPPSPPNIRRFFRRFLRRWNRLVCEAAAFCGEKLGENSFNPSAGLTAALKRLRQEHPGDDFRPAFLEPTLAEFLRRLEADFQMGLGVGHSLTAIVYLDGSS